MTIKTEAEIACPVTRLEEEINVRVKAEEPVVPLAAASYAPSVPYAPATSVAVPTAPYAPSVAVPPTTAAYTATTTSSSAVPSHQQSQVPPNAPPGGQWVMKKHIGQKTWTTCTIVSVITCFFCLFPCGVWALLCPCDKKLVYISQGKAYDEQGRVVGPA
jgi:hypothetical protein